MIDNLTLTQGILMYILGFFISLTIFKFMFAYKPNNLFPRVGREQHILDIVFFSLTWMLTIPIFIIIVIFVLIYRFCKWYLEL